jgi:ubiquinone/menaquinone biosynthesis C-methylase UbiE
MSFVLNRTTDKTTIENIQAIWQKSLNQKSIELEWKLGKTVFENNVRKHVPNISPNKYYELYNILENSSSIKSSSITTINIYPDEVREIIYENNIKEYQKKYNLSSYDVSLVNCSIKLSASIEEKVENYIPTLPPNMVRQRIRKSYTFEEIIDNSNVKYTIDLTKVKTYFNNKEKVNYECELEFFDPSKLTFKQLIFSFKEKILIPLFGPFSVMTYNNSRNIIKECNSINKINEYKSLEIRRNKPRNLKPEDLLGLSPNDLKGKYTATNKLDGVSYLLFIISSGIVIVNSKDVQIILSTTTNLPFLNTVVEGELYEKNFYIYDALFYKGQNIQEKHHLTRISFVPDFIKFLQSLNINNVFLKKFSNSALEIYEDIKKDEKSNDGIIFTPTDKPYINKNTCKFKFSKLMSIDFLLKNVKHIKLSSTDNSNQILEAVISEVYSIDKNNKLILFENDNVKFPFFFFKKDFPYDFNNNDIVECVLRKNYIYPSGFWFPLRLRDDKTSPNFIDVAKDVFIDIINEKDFFYFFQSIKIPFRKFHTDEKRKFITKYLKNTETVLDLGFGKGGDIFKYNEANVKTIYGIEPNSEYIKEAKERLQNKNINTKIEIIQDYAQNTKSIQEKLPFNFKADVVSMFFSLTFFFQSKELLNNLVKTISTFLKVGGKFVGFTLDGMETYKWLKEKDTIEVNNCYKIVKKYKENKDKKSAYGLEILIDIPDDSQKNYKSIVNSQTEWLVIFNTLKTKLEKKGIYLEFTEFCKPPSNLICGEEYVSKTRKFIFIKKEEKDEDEEEKPEEKTEEKTEEKPEEKKISVFLKPDTSEDINLYGLNFVRTGTIGEGSCFFHSLLYAISQDEEFNIYRKLDLNQRKKFIIDIRNDIADKLTLEKFLKINNGSYSYFKIVTKLQSYFNKRSKELFDELINIFQSNTSLEEYYEAYKKLVKNKKKLNVFDNIAYKEFEDYVSKLRDPTEYVDLYDLDVFDLVTEYFKTNIYIVNDNLKYFNLMREYSPNKYTIIIINLNDIHFEIVGEKVGENINYLFNEDSLIIKKLTGKEEVKNEGEVKNEEEKFSYRFLIIKNNELFPKLINKFFDIETTKLNTIIDEKKDDKSILLELKKYIKPAFEQEERAKFRINEIQKFFPDFFPNTKNSIDKYLDFGCSDGVITSEIGNKLGLLHENIIGADVEGWKDATSKGLTDKMNFVKITENGSLPFEDNSFNYITSFMCLHHIHPSFIENRLKELYRVMKDNGTLLIREHDCISDNNKILIDLEHIIYEVCYKEPSNLSFLDTYEAWYKESKDWKKLLIDSGFTFVNESKASKLNYSRPYYAKFKK